MEELDMATLNVNTASIIANDATESSEGSDTSDSEDYMTKYGIVEKMDTDEENRRKEATWKWFQENRTSSEEENNEVEYISTDTAESKMRELRQQMSQEDLPGAQRNVESSDSSADSPSSKKSRNRQSKRQRDQNQKYKKMINEKQEKFYYKKE